MTAPDSGLLRVDLTAETVTREPIPDEWRRRYLGGKGLGARYLYEELDAGVDPLGPENVVLVLVGPLTGVLPGDDRFVVVTKSPLTGGFVDSYGGGTFPGRFAHALGDCLGILVTGRASDPLVLELGDGDPRLAAAETWGLDVPATTEHHPDAAVACIGRAGENEVAYASVATDGGDHQAARGGVGAVFGAKRLKAIVAHGPDDPPSVAHPDALARLHAAYEHRARDDPESRWRCASETLETVDFADEVGVLSTRGWQESQFDAVDDIGMTAALDAATGRERETDAVPGGFRFDTGDAETVPRGSTLMTLGAGLGIDDFEDVLSLGALCDHVGMDVITAGNAVAWAMRASEADALDHDLGFGDTEAARDLLEAIVARDTDLGDALAGGVANAASRYGLGDAIPTVKRMEVPAYDPRGSPAMALAYATSDRGACHRRSLPVETEAFETGGWPVETAVSRVVADQDASSLLWSLVVDDLVADAFRDDLCASWLRAIGVDVDAATLAEAGERIWTLTRLFNVREGFTRADDALPATMREALPDGPNEGRRVDPETFDRMLDTYYEARGWTANGVPTRETLRELGLLQVVDGG